jgi:molybdopterin-guanine dinucleotide biosynthesis protein B
MAAWDGRADACLPAVAGLPLPLFGLYHPRCLPVLERALAVGERHLSETLTRLIVHSVPFADATPFAPIATADEYARVQRLLAPPPQPFPGPATSGTQPALLAIVGKSDAGKTTVVERLLPELQRLGLRVGTVKHDAHDFQIDHPGTDSYRHGAAGAPAYTVASPHRLAFVTLLDEDLPLVEIARRFYPGFDLVLAEGYKRLAPYRVEIYRRAAGHPEPLCASEEMLAVLSDAEVPHPKRFVLDDIAGLAAFIVMRLGSLRQY